MTPAQQRMKAILAGRISRPAAPGGAAGHPAPLFRWPTDPHGKKPVHTITYAQHQRNSAPIVPGSSINNKTLGQQSAAAVTEKYGPADAATRTAVGQAAQHETDIGSWYDAYLKELATHQQNVAGIQQQAQNSVNGLATIQGPAGAQPQDPGNQDVAAKAQAIREALLGAMKGGLIGEGRAASTYADTLAHVVGPGQKLTAKTKAADATKTARDQLTELGREKGAYRTDFEDTARQNETKNVLAGQALGLDKYKVDTSAGTAAANTRERRRHDRATETASTAKGYGPGRPGLNKFGYTADEWAALSPAAKTRARAGKPKAAKPTDPATQYAKDFYAKYGVQPASTTKVANGRDAISAARSLVSSILASNPKMTRQQLGPLLLSGQKGVKDDPKTKPDESSSAIPKVSALWATVALDLAFLHGVSRGTADRLHRSGYSVKLLGLPSTPRTAPPRGGAPSAPDGHGGSRPT